MATIHTKKNTNRGIYYYQDTLRKIRKKNNSMAIGYTENYASGDLGITRGGPDNKDLDPFNSDLNCVLQNLKGVKGTDGDRNVQKQYTLKSRL